MYASPNIIRVIKSRRIRWTAHVTNMGKMRNGIWTKEGRRGRRLEKTA
jgi:hypothetical protein